MTPNGAIAALVPMTVVIATRIGRPPSKLLMPLAFSAHAGALLLLTGSPVNFLVADAAADSGPGGSGSSSSPWSASRSWRDQHALESRRARGPG
jgi:hypothetical protein